MMYDEPNMDSHSRAYPYPESRSPYGGYGYGHSPYDPYKYMEKHPYREGQSWYVPDVGLDGMGEPYRSYAARQGKIDYDVPERLRPPVVPNGNVADCERSASALQDDGSLDDPMFDEDDVTVGEIVVGITLLAVFAVGCVVTARAGLNVVRRLAEFV